MFEKDLSPHHQTSRSGRASLSRNQMVATCAAPSRTLATLTERERQTLTLIAEGESTKRIAMTLGVSTKTVETHRSRLMDKLGLDSVVGLAKYAIRNGLAAL